MQKEIKSNLTLTIAKLELKQLEFIDKLSTKHDDYIIRCVTSPDTYKFLALNGDWEKVTNFTEEECVGKSWNEFVKEPTDIIKTSEEAFDKDGGFDTYICDVKKQDGSYISVSWKAKLFTNINAIVSIGRVKK